MKSLKNTDLNNKKVIVRCDFNLSLKDGQIIDDFRITQALPTIEHLQKQGAKIILMSHFGRPEDRKSFQKEGIFSALKESFSKSDRKLSLRPIYEQLDEYLDNVQFVENCVGKSVQRKVDSLESGDILLLENLRYYQDEFDNGREFANCLAGYGDVYVNNAFSASHRKHASLSRLPELMDEVYPGLLLEREMRFLGEVKEDAERPLAVIVGGAKVDSKIQTIKHFLQEADHILLGGKVANVILNVRGLSTNKPLPPSDIMDKLDDISLTSPKLHLPVDVIVNQEGTEYGRETGVGEVKKEEEIYDIGPDTVNMYGDVLQKAETIIWAGPLGYFEKEDFQSGTCGVAERLVKNREALKIAGGGDTSYALKKFSVRDFFDHVSVGGGAMLTFLSDGEMPGLQALKDES